MHCRFGDSVDLGFDLGAAIEQTLLLARHRRRRMNTFAEGHGGYRPVMPEGGRGGRIGFEPSHGAQEP